MDTAGSAIENHDEGYSNNNTDMAGVQTYFGSSSDMAPSGELGNDNAMTLADIEQVVDADPNAYHFDYEQAQQDYGHGVPPGEDTQLYQNQQNYDLGIGGLSSTIPGYCAVNQDQRSYHEYSARPPIGFASEIQDVYHGGVVQAQYTLNTGHNPFMPQVPYISGAPYVPQTPYVEAGPSSALGMSDDIMADANSFFSSTGDVSFNSQTKQKVEPNDEITVQPQPVHEAKPTKTQSSRAKGKRKVMDDETDVEADGDGDSHNDAKPSAAKGRKKVGSAVASAKRTRAAAEMDDDTDGDAKPPAVKGGKKGGSAATAAKRTRTTNEKNRKGEPRTRKAAKNGIKTQSKVIPKTYEECDEADKALVDMRDAGKTWKEIGDTYASLCGTRYGGSTLPNRYERMKDKFASMREEDHVLLFDAKKSIEGEFEGKKWRLIAEDVASKGGQTYEPEVLQRRFKALMQKEGLPVNEGPATRDPDFVIGNGAAGAQGDAQRRDEDEKQDEDDEASD